MLKIVVLPGVIIALLFASGCDRECSSAEETSGGTGDATRGGATGGSQLPDDDHPTIVGCFSEDDMLREYPDVRWSFVELKSDFSLNQGAPNLRIRLALRAGGRVSAGEQISWEVEGFASERWEENLQAPTAFQRTESVCATAKMGATLSYENNGLHNTDDVAKVEFDGVTYTLRMNFIPSQGVEMEASIVAKRGDTVLWEDDAITNVSCRVEPPFDSNQGC